MGRPSTSPAQAAGEGSAGREAEQGTARRRGGAFPAGRGAVVQAVASPRPGFRGPVGLADPSSLPLVPIPGLISPPPPRAHPGSEPGCPECFSGNQPEGRLSCLAAVAR